MCGLTTGQYVVFIPFAGGSGHAFKAIRTTFPAAVNSLDIHYSGRYHGESALLPDSVDQMADHVIEQLWRTRPAHVVLFGYSLGALVAYEVSQRSPELPCPILELVVAACRPPHLFSCQVVRLHDGDDEFLESVATFGTIPEALFKRSAARKYLLPKLKSDFTAAQAYRHSPREKLDIKVTAVGGSEDSFAPFEEMKGWREYCSFGFSEHCLPGRHFFHESQATTLSRILTDAFSAQPIS